MKAYSLRVNAGMSFTHLSGGVTGRRCCSVSGTPKYPHNDDDPKDCLLQLTSVLPVGAFQKPGRFQQNLNIFQKSVDLLHVRVSGVKDVIEATAGLLQVLLVQERRLGIREESFTLQTSALPLTFGHSSCFLETVSGLFRAAISGCCTGRLFFFGRFLIPLCYERRVFNVSGCCCMGKEIPAPLAFRSLHGPCACRSQTNPS